MKYEVVCTECGIIHPEVMRKGEVVEPSPKEKASVIAELHESENEGCEVYVLLKNER